jgi:penicillin-binding protein 1A
MNVLAVKVMVETGIDICYDYLLNFGFTTLKDDNHAATALGGLTNGVTQVELAAAYGTLANNGEYIRPMFYDKVLDHNGNVLLENTMEAKQVVKPSTGYIITQMMTSVVNEGTGTAAKFTESEMPLAGKTGTTTDSKDLTFVGYTPYYVASIWYGYDRYDSTVSNMNNLNQTTHLKVWKKVMEQVNEGLEVKDFPMPDDVVKATVCKYTGYLASSSCPAVTDYFVKNDKVETY